MFNGCINNKATALMMAAAATAVTEPCGLTIQTTPTFESGDNFVVVLLSVDVVR